LREFPFSEGGVVSCGLTDRRTGTEKLVVAFRNSANAQKKMKEILKQLVRPLKFSVCSGYPGFESRPNILSIHMCVSVQDIPFC
jgi:hypothetical protein